MSFFPPPSLATSFLQRASAGFQGWVQLNIVHRPFRLQVCNLMAERQQARHSTSIFTFRGASRITLPPPALLPPGATVPTPPPMPQAPPARCPSSEASRTGRATARSPLSTSCPQPPGTRPPKRKSHTLRPLQESLPRRARGGRGSQSQAVRPQQHFETASSEGATSGLLNPSRRRASGEASGNHGGSTGGLERWKG